MRNILNIVVVFCIFSFIIPAQLCAVVNPLSVPNNTYGIHIIDEHDLDDAARLVNGNGGKWGYVTIVVIEEDRNTEKWQRIFDRMRKLQLIPVVRIATKPDGGIWEKPRPDDAKEWVTFFNSLNWVVQNRYIILFNEPNHANEWGGTIQPAEYVAVVMAFHDAFREASDDYFILPAGFDLAAGNTAGTMDTASYFENMYETNNKIFTLFDGWTSHSYPNPAFSGSVYGQGKQSIRGYEWELNYLSRFGLPKTTPVFITETGWVHKQGTSDMPQYHSTADIADFYEKAFTSIWTSPSIVMVSPFVLNYQSEPFDHFSWKKFGSTEFYDHYDRVLNIKKTEGVPTQIDTFELSTEKIPDTLKTGSFYLLPIAIRNTGQKIWDDTTALNITIVGAIGESRPAHRPVPKLEPMHDGVVHVPFKSPDVDTLVPLVITVTTKEGSVAGEIVSKTVTIQEPSSLWGQLMAYLSGPDTY